MTKRAIDIVISTFALIIFSPVIFVVGFLCLFILGYPIFFIQARPGLNNKNFNFVKFRTMTSQKSKNGNLLSDELRLTSFGKFLRSTSLDEIPSFWNVLKGDMSLVGPRPLLEEYLKLYSAQEILRHKVKPGITGWAQINGRNNISWKEKFKLDLWYVENQSFYLDFKILFLTIWKVIKRENINSFGHVTTNKFNGNN